MANPRNFLVLGTLIVFASSGARAEGCNPGLSSAGWIVPKGDLYVEEGRPVELFCILNTTHPDGVGGSWQNLSFRVDGQPASWPWIQEKENETAIRLSWNETTVTPRDFYSVTCFQNGNTGVCNRYVYVGYPPLNVTDFQCTSYNWERLECTWLEPYNPISTSYALSYVTVLNSRSRRMMMPCPGDSSPSRTFVVSKATSPADPGPGQCVWAADTSPPYVPSTGGFNFTMSMVNDLDKRTQYLGLVNNSAIMIPNAMENLSPVWIQPRNASVSWKIPYNLLHFPPGLEFRVAYQILAGWADPALFYDVVEAAGIKWSKTNLSYQLDMELPYPNAWYKVSVWARSVTANKTDPRFWSVPASIVIQTKPDKPCRAPDAVLGSFQVNNLLEERSVTIRWSQLPPDCENGPSPGYSVALLDSQDRFLETKNVNVTVSDTAVTDVKFDNLYRERAYKFLVYSQNLVGYSPNASEVFVPSASNMPTAPSNVMRIAYNDTLFEIQWGGSTASRSLSMATFGHQSARLDYASSLTHYTVFWCRTVRDTHPVTCLGALYTREVPPGTTSLNVTVPEAGANYQFAVEAHQGAYYGSGMTWSDCIVQANGTSSEIKEVNVVGATSSSLDVAWELPCSVRGGIVSAFNIYYCPADVEGTYGDLVDSEEPRCSEPPHKVQVEPSVSRYTIRELDPFTFYKIVMTVTTRLGEGQTSVPSVNRTLEGVPTVPLDLNPVEVGNQSVSIAWRAPTSPNGPSTYYKIIRNGLVAGETTETEMTLRSECYTNYTMTVQACNGPFLCSDYSDPISIRTLVGTPSVPNAPRLKTKTDNSSFIEVTWDVPAKPAGPIDYSLVSVLPDGEDQEGLDPIRVEGGETQLLLALEEVCTPGAELRVRVMAVNQAENKADLYMSGWSDEGVYQCKSEGLSLAQILGISFGAALLVLIVCGVTFCVRRCQRKTEKARTAEVKPPWVVMSGGGSLSKGGGGGGIKETQQTAKSAGFHPAPSTATANYYGQPNPKMKMTTTTMTSSPAVTDEKKVQQLDAPGTEGDTNNLDRQSQSSGRSSGPDSLPWHHSTGGHHHRQHAGSELSSDSGAELDPNSPLPDCVFPEAPLDRFMKAASGMDLVSSSTPMGYTTMQLRTSAPNLQGQQQQQQQPQPYVQVGLASPPPSQTLAASPSAGYVTLGASQLAGQESHSPNSSPNLSVGSNDSLIAKSERPVMKILPLRRSSGYVDPPSSLSAPEDQPDPATSTTTTSPGYVTLKSQEMINDSSASPSWTASATTTTTPPSMTPAPGGYVTLGTASSGNPPPTSAHYVQMGSQPNNHHHNNPNLSYV